MKLLQVIPTLELGGAQRHVLLLTAALAQRQHEVHLALASVEHPWVSEVDEGVTVHDLRAPRHTDLLAGRRRLKRLCEHLRPDVVISNLWHGHALTSAVARNPAAGKSVAVEHSLLSWYAEKVDYGRLKLSYFQRLYGRFDALVAVSEMVRDELEHLPKVDRPVAVIPNALFSSTSQIPLSERSHDIIVVGRLIGPKRPVLAVEAYAALLRRMPSYPGDLVFVGDGVKAAAVREAATRHGIAGQVRLSGFMQDPMPMYRRARLLLHLSVVESFGNVLLEASSVGLPFLLASDIRLPAEFGAAGVMHQASPEPDALAEAMVPLVTEGDLWSAGSRAQGALAMRSLAESVATQYEALAVAITS